MKRFLSFITAVSLVFLAGAAAADDIADLLCFKNGIRPDSLPYADQVYQDLPSQGFAEGLEIRNGLLYDTSAEALLIIPDDIDFGGTLTVAPGTRYICADALSVNPTVRQVILPDGLEVIGRYSLTGTVGIADDAAAVQTVSVPASVRLIQEPLGTWAYSAGCSKPFFAVDENNPRYRSTADGLLIDILDSAVLWCASFTETRTVTVPDGIRRIAPFAFAGCNEIISVSLPDSLTEIGEGAFSMMTGLTEITIPENVLRVGPGNFSSVGRDGYEQWYQDHEGHAIIAPSGGQEGLREITDTEALSMFGIDRRPGITFRGTSFEIQIRTEPSDGIYINNCFDPCYLTVECPAGAFFLDYLDAMSEYCAPGWPIIVDEPNGTTRILHGE